MFNEIREIEREILRMEKGKEKCYVKDRKKTKYVSVW